MEVLISNRKRGWGGGASAEEEVQLGLSLPLSGSRLSPQDLALEFLLVKSNNQTVFGRIRRCGVVGSISLVLRFQNPRPTPTSLPLPVDPM